LLAAFLAKMIFGLDLGKKNGWPCRLRQIGRSLRILSDKGGQMLSPLRFFWVLLKGGKARSFILIIQRNHPLGNPLKPTPIRKEGRLGGYRRALPRLLLLNSAIKRKISFSSAIFPDFYSFLARPDRSGKSELCLPARGFLEGWVPTHSTLIELLSYPKKRAF